MGFSLKFYVCFIAALTTAVGKDMVYYKCTDFPLTDRSTSGFELKCEPEEKIIVKSAIIGLTDKFISPNQCPMTNKTCLMETTIPADLCTGRNSCFINQNVLLANESKIPCSYSSTTVGNFININYTCIIQGPNNYGSICYFDDTLLYSNDSVYISSYPNFPEAMGANANYQCACLFKSTNSTSSSSADNVTIRALLVKLTSAITTCSERLSIMNSKTDAGLTFCSPCNNANNVTTVSFASNTVLLFRRDAIVSPINGKFILEITASSKSSGSGPIGFLRCGLVVSRMSSSTSVSSTNVQNTSLGSTVKSSNASSNTQQTTMSPTNTGSDTQNYALFSSNAPSTDVVGPTSDSQNAIGKRSIGLSTGAIVGIVLGSVGFIVVVIMVLLCLLRKKKQHQDNRNGNTHFKNPKSLTVVQNLHRTSNIEFDDAASSELHTFQSAEQFSNEPQTGGYENNRQRKDDYVSNYEEGTPVPHITNGPGMIPTNQRRRLNDKMADNLTTEMQSRNSGVDDVTLVENQLYGEYETTMTNATTSSDYDFVRPVATSSDYDVAKPVVAASDYDVARPVVQDVKTNESAEVDRDYARTQNSSSDHSYYNVPIGTTRVQPSAEVSGIETTDTMPKADSEVVLIDNTLYGSMLSV